MRRLISCFLATFLFAGIGHAAEPRPVTLDPATHRAASLSVTGVDGLVVTYAPSDLENMPTYAMETTTPWRQDMTLFEGVLLKDVLAASGLMDVEVIEVLAENDYAITIPDDVWELAPVMVATRANGKPLTRRDRGPLLFVIPAEYFARHDVITNSHLVWMAASIAPVE